MNNKEKMKLELIKRLNQPDSFYADFMKTKKHKDTFHEYRLFKCSEFGFYFRITKEEGQKTFQIDFIDVNHDTKLEGDVLFDVSDESFMVNVEKMVEKIFIEEKDILLYTDRYIAVYDEFNHLEWEKDEDWLHTLKFLKAVDSESKESFLSEMEDCYRDDNCVIVGCQLDIEEKTLEIDEEGRLRRRSSREDDLDKIYRIRNNSELTKKEVKRMDNLILDITFLRENRRETMFDQILSELPY